METCLTHTITSTTRHTHMSMFGMNGRAEVSIEKPVRIVSKSNQLTNEVSRRCTGRHTHAIWSKLTRADKLRTGESSRAFAQAIIRGVEKHELAKLAIDSASTSGRPLTPQSTAKRKHIAVEGAEDERSANLTQYEAFPRQRFLKTKFQFVRTRLKRCSRIQPF